MIAPGVQLNPLQPLQPRDLLAVLRAPVNLTASRRFALETIVDEFAAAGHTPAMAIAAIVNAWAESRWDVNAFNPEDDLGAQKGWGSLGLFQLLKSGHNPPRGAAARWGLPPLNADGTPAASDFRRDARTNTRGIIAEVDAYYDTSRWGGQSYPPSLKGAQESGQVKDVVSAFARHIERPAQRYAKGEERASLAYELFPTLAGLPADLLQWGELPPTQAQIQSAQAAATAASAVKWIVIAIVVAVILYVAWRWSPAADTP